MQSSRPKLGKAHVQAALLLQAVFLVSIALETAACWFLFDGAYPPSESQWKTAALWHVGAAAVPLTYAFIPKRFPGIGWYLPKIAGLLTLFLPVVGVLGSALTINMTRIFVRSKGLAHEFESSSYHLDSDSSATINRSMDDLLKEELATEPIVDILRGEDDDLKRGAIMLLKRMKNSRAVALLKESLSDSSTEVRFFAHTALTQLEEDAVKRLEKAEEKAAEGGADDLRLFATTCKEYALSGLPEETMKNFYLKEAKNQFEKAFNASKAPVNLIDIGLVDIELKDFTNALTTFTKAQDWNETLLMARLGKCWVYFETGDWENLKLETKHMSRVSIPDDAQQGENEYIRALFTFWATQKTPAHSAAADGGIA